MKIQKLLIVLGIILFQVSLFAQKNTPLIADAKIPLAGVEQVIMPPLDNEMLKQEELQRRGPGIAPRFAQSMDVDISPASHGNWEVIEGEDLAVWRVRIASEGAYTLNLGFDRFKLPSKSILIMYNENKDRVMGPFTPADNEDHEQLWTPVFEGDALVIELQVSLESKDEVQLHLKTVNHDFLGFTSALSGSCNLDVICGEADGWGIVDGYRDIIQSVGVYSTGGTTFCTGFLVNNTSQDCTPLFMTANHCLSQGDAPSLVVYWNFFNSTCRQPYSGASSSGGDGLLTDFNTGAIYKSNYPSSDFFLVELDDPVSETANAFFAGWSAEEALVQDMSIAIHHPNTDEKRISFDYEAPFVSYYYDNTPNANGDHITVSDWDVGTTEGGSSGSPLFNVNKHVIGQLHGGDAACGNDGPDYYGRFHTSWEGGGSSSSRLKDWLDPNNTGQIVIDGRWQNQCGYYVESDIINAEVCAEDTYTYQLTISDNFTNNVNLSINGLPSGVSANFSNNSPAPGANSSLTISGLNSLTDGQYSFIVNGENGLETSLLNLNINYVSGTANASLINPANNETGTVLTPTLSWENLGNGVTYSVRIATDANFTNIIDSSDGLFESSYTTSVLETLTQYYWSVRATNFCGEGAWSDTFTFTTADIACATFNASDLPIAISEQGMPQISSTIDISLSGVVTSVSITNLNIQHSYVGDLTVVLIAPDGTSITLFDRPGYPGSSFGCGGTNISINLSDLYSNTSDDLENSCGGGAYAISGDYQSIDPFSNLVGLVASGSWTLQVSDAAGFDGGSLDSWSLNICTAAPNEATLLATSDNITVCAGETFSIPLMLGVGFNGDVNLNLTNVPDQSNLDFSTNPALPGQTIDFSGTIDNPGSYILNLTATDGTETAVANIGVEVIDIPVQVGALFPLDGSIDQNIGLSIAWSTANDADNYSIVIAENEQLTNIVTSTTVLQTTLDISSLNYGQTYYWAVTANGACENTTSEVFSFTTIPDLNVTATPVVQTACLSDQAEFSINIPAALTAPVDLSVSSPSGTQPVFTTNGTITPGENISITITNILDMGVGSHILSFDLDDGHYQTGTTAELYIASAPELAILAFPAEGDAFVDPNISFLWDITESTSESTIEIASDPDFVNIIESNTVTGSLYTATNIGEAGTYYWRITTINDCGASTGTSSSFDYSPTAVNELQPIAFRVYPSPADAQILIEFGYNQSEEYQLTIFNNLGQMVQQTHVEAGTQLLPLNVSQLPEEVYLLKVTGNNKQSTTRFVINR